MNCAVIYMTLFLKKKTSEMQHLVVIDRASYSYSDMAASSSSAGQTSSLPRAETIAAEVAEIHGVLPACVVKVATSKLVQLQISRGAYAKLVFQVHFPSTYPNGALCCELKSNSLPITALKRLEELADNGAASRAKLSQPAVLHIYNLLDRVVQKNLLLVSFDEVNSLRRRYKAPEVVIETRDVRGEVSVSVSSAGYFTKGIFKLPQSYPVDPCSFDIETSQCPPSLIKIFSATTREKGRKLIRPKPSQPPVVVNTLEPMVRFFIDELAGRYPKETCQMCKRRMLPEVASDSSVPRPKPARIVRIYCSHLFHGGCLKKYLETPPFDKGKKCPSQGCGKQIFHKNFKAAGDLKIAQTRWASKEAHKREIREVAEFMAVSEEDKKEEEEDDNWGAFY